MTASIKKYERSLVSPLLYGCLPIEVETGRYHKVARQERVCKLCNNRVEDELHFLFECEMNKPEKFLNNDVVSELDALGDNIGKLKLLAARPHIFGKFIHNMWSNRNEMLLKCNVNTVLNNI